MAITKENAKDFLPFIKALSKGKKIQFFNGEEWVALSLLDSFAIYSLCMNFCYQNIILLIGTANFNLSDFILAYHSFVKNIKYGNFYLMTTYIIAQSFIAIGMAL